MHETSLYEYDTTRHIMNSIKSTWYGRQVQQGAKGHATSFIRTLCNIFSRIIYVMGQVTFYQVWLFFFRTDNINQILLYSYMKRCYAQHSLHRSMIPVYCLCFIQYYVRNFNTLLMFVIVL